MTDLESGTGPISRPSEVLTNAGSMGVLATRIYQDTQRVLGQDVTASTPFCTLVNRAALSVLISEGINGAEYLEHEDPSHRGSVSHAFLKVVEGSKKWALDFQYKQYVPEAERATLPDYMLIPYNSRDDVVEGLTRHKVPENVHNRWVDELFWDED